LPPGLGVADFPPVPEVACPVLGDADDGATAGDVSRLDVADATTGVPAAGLDATVGAEGGDDTDPGDAEADEVEPPTDARVVGSEAAGS
jgi:hypothetical protein